MTDLSQGDIFAELKLDQVLLPVNNPEGPVSLHLPDVARLEPSEKTVQSQLNPGDREQCCGSGSGAFLTPGSGIRNRFFPDPGS
jgi:hypothetical protein